MARHIAVLVTGCVLLLLAGEASPDAQATGQKPPAPDAGWTQWAGPTRDFHAPSTGLADAWPTGGPPVLWSRPLGTGHSSIVMDPADGGRLFTMYRAGNGRAKVGPWKQEEVVVALDAKTGATIWEHSYPARTGFEDFSFGPGPHATPLVVGDRVFTIGTTQQLFAFEKRTGKVIWSHDFVKEFKSPELLLRPNVKTGYGCSPIAFADTIICSVGGPGQSVMAFRQSDGAIVWKSGDFLTSASAPILITLAGRPQVVFLGGGAVTGLNPATGAILWSHPHDPGNDLNCTTPLFGGDNVLFLSSAYQAGSRALKLTETAAGTEVAELWFTNRVRFMFLSAIRVGDFVYGTTGDFGPAFLTALNIKTGESAWQVRGFARASLLYADGKMIVMNEDGDLAIARLSPTGAEILSRAKIFDTVTWTAPTLVGTTLYARDREKIVALDLGTPGPKASPESDLPRPTVSLSSTALARPPSAPQTAAPPPGAAASPRPPVSRPPVSRPADFAGSWKLDGIEGDATFNGLAAAGAPPWLFVTQPENGTLVIESPVNTSHTRFFRPGSPTTTEIANGTITLTTSWVGKSLVAEGSAKSSGGAVTSVKETISRDGEALVIHIEAGDKTSRIRYSRLTEIGPCTTFPNPCKKAGS